jgi:hypothetical protein
MRVEDFCGVGFEIIDAHALEAALMRRHGEDANEFWLSHSGQRYPGISLLVKGELAALHYFPREEHPGFRAVGSLAGLNPDGMTTFWMSVSGDTIDVLNDAVMPFAFALTAAKEFLTSDGLPESVKWFEL